ncbi:alpha/beta hydrolase fold domain-containing protein [Bacillus sp. SD088]|nr:alpha/beta hydrolase fold domain-containing protein [Bacillus sp. SD088]
MTSPFLIDDLSNIPPVLIVIAEYDLLRDDKNCLNIIPMI